MAVLLFFEHHSAGTDHQAPLKPWRIEQHSVKVPGGLAWISLERCGGPAGPLARNRAGLAFYVRLTGGGLSLRPAPACPSARADGEPGMLPDGEITRGDGWDMRGNGMANTGGGPIARAWLADPTTEYRHGVLGDAIEAGTLMVRTRDGRRLEYRLPAGSVFEDRKVRLVRFRDGGPQRLLVVRSRAGQGAALALFGLEGDRLRLLAESQPFGRANRWLNPVGVADFDGDGRREVAAVLTPHIGGVLTLYAWRGKRLEPEHRARGFSNHVIGSRNLALSAVLDLNGDGTPDLVVPDSNRRSLRAVTFAGGRFRELAVIKYRAEVVAGLVLTNLDGKGGQELLLGLSDGTLVAWVR